MNIDVYLAIGLCPNPLRELTAPLEPLAGFNMCPCRRKEGRGEGKQIAAIASDILSQSVKGLTGNEA